MRGLLLVIIALFALGIHGQTSADVSKPADRPFRILHKPQPGYPENAGCVSGTVILRIDFLSTGEIGKMSVVKSLPNGLTDSAITAAKRIKFESLIKDGESKTVTKQVDFSFSLY